MNARGSDIVWKLGWIVLALSAGCEAPRGPDVETGDDGTGDDGPPVARRWPIVFTSDRDVPGSGELYLATRDGSATQRLTFGGDFWLPRWSPGGEAIAFRQVVDGGNAEVGVVSPTGSGLVLLTQGEPPKLNYLPANWSPDASLIAFASFVDPADASTRRLWMMPRTGGRRERVFPELELPQSELAWSPDGRFVAHTETSADGQLDVWLSEADADDQGTNLTQGRIRAPSFITWSPDSTRIAMSGFALNADGTLEDSSVHPPPDEVFVVDAVSGELTRVTDNTVQDVAPAWSPDGAALLVTSARDGNLDLWVVPLDAPGDAWNLIDDNDDPHEDSLGHWYVRPP